MMLSLTLTLLFTNDDVNDADNADDVDDINNVNNADVDDADNKRRRRKSSIEEEKESRLDTSLDRVERLVKCCFFASLAVSQSKSIKHDSHVIQELLRIVMKTFSKNRTRSSSIKIEKKFAL
jgi:hypothetical protein